VGCLRGLVRGLGARGGWAKPSLESCCLAQSRLAFLDRVLAWRPSARRAWRPSNTSSSGAPLARRPASSSAYAPGAPPARRACWSLQHVLARHPTNTSPGVSSAHPPGAPPARHAWRSLKHVVVRRPTSTSPGAPPTHTRPAPLKHGVARRSTSTPSGILQHTPAWRPTNRVSNARMSPSLAPTG